MGVTLQEGLRVTLMLIAFCAILFLTYVTTRYVGGKQNRAMKGKNIAIVESVALGMDKRLHLVKAGKQYVLIATTSKNVEFLTSVDLDESEEAEQNELQAGLNTFDFKSLFEKYVNMYRAAKKEKGVATKAADADREPESSDFKANLQRMRTIVQKSGFQIKKNEDDITNEK